MIMSKKKATKKEENSLNLETILFNCRDYLRGSASLNDKRDVILTLVFLRFIGEKFDDAQAEMRQQCINRGITDEEKIARFLDSPSRYKNIVYVPEAARWSMLINVPASNLVAALDDALQAIEDSGDTLKGCVKLSLFTSVKIQSNELKKVVDEVNKISHKVFGEEKDLIGRVYEYFLKSFAVNATKEEGEFYTPHDIVELIAAFIEPFDGTLYDPCCGSGGMFIQCAKYVEAKQGDITTVNVFGQEKEDSTFRLAKMNLAMRGISHHLGDGPISTFDKDQHAGLVFDYIMANPPFNLKHWFTKDVTQQGVNWADYGTPPESNANYAWIQHMIHHLAPNGEIGLVLANGALSTQSSGEGEIRRKIIEDDLVEGIIAMPTQLFYSVTIPVTLWFITKGKKQKGKTLFIDARKMGHMVDRKHRDFSEEDIQKLADTFEAFQNGTLEDVKGFCAVATLQDIAKQDYILTPGRYVGIEEQEDDGEPFEEKMARLTSELSDMFAKSHELEEEIRRKLGAIGYEI